MERSVNPTDGRGALIALTTAGIGLIDEVFPEILDLERELLRQVPANEWGTITDALRRVVASVESHRPEVKE